MSEELSTGFFSINGRLSRLAYIIQNSILMTFAFQYLYYPYIIDSILGMQHNPMFKNVFIMLKSDPMYADMLTELGHAPKPDFTFIATKFLFIAALRIVDLKRIRDIVNRKLTTLETVFAVVGLSLPFIDLISTIFLMTLPAKKRPTMTTDPFLKKAMADNLSAAQKEQIMRHNKELFESGKISRLEYQKAREKYKS